MSYGKYNRQISITILEYKSYLLAKAANQLTLKLLDKTNFKNSTR